MPALFAFVIGFILDFLVGDPIGWPHIVLAYGRMIGFLERALRRLLPATPGGQRAGGVLLAALMCAVPLGVSAALLLLCGRVHPALRVAVESLLVWQCLAVRSLRVAGLSVYEPLSAGDIPAARAAVAEIVGRDTSELDAGGITRAAVETIAENTADGVIAPLLFMAVGGAPLGLMYKAINTMDSLLGYKNDAYLFFGRAAARLDDVAGFIPARLGGLFMALAAFPAGLDGKNALRIFRRDRKKHISPNSAHTEAACAGALGIRLGGGGYYGGRLVEKPTIGDDDRPAEPGDILRANRLLASTALLFFLACAIVKGVIAWL